jgi:hypothetical protein
MPGAVEVTGSAPTAERNWESKLDGPQPERRICQQGRKSSGTMTDRIDSPATSTFD